MTLVYLRKNIDMLLTVREERKTGSLASREGM